MAGDDIANEINSNAFLRTISCIETGDLAISIELRTNVRLSEQQLERYIAKERTVVIHLLHAEEKQSQLETLLKDWVRICR